MGKAPKEPEHRVLVGVGGKYRCSDQGCSLPKVQAEHELLMCSDSGVTSLDAWERGQILPWCLEDGVGFAWDVGMSGCSLPVSGAWA